MVCEIVKTGETPRLWIRVIDLFGIFFLLILFGFIGFSFDFRRSFSRR
jgi:hypothetical protein